MMADTAQPVAAETEAVSEDAIAAAAQAFKSYDPEAPERAERLRNERGQFTSAQEEEEIEAEEEQSEHVENDEEAVEEEEAADEAQQSVPEMPASWAKDDQELWESLPPEAQGKIAEREGQREAAVNQKFQESANAKKAAEALAAEAQTNRANYAQALDTVIQLVQPQWPSPTMLDINSDDYNPDEYHLQRAKAEQNHALLQRLSHQRQEVAAQEKQEEAAREQQAAMALNQATLPALELAYPEIKDPAKAQPFLAGLMDYAMSMGTPKEFFEGQITAVEWHILADAKKWRDHQEALKKVKAEKPEPKKAQPSIRPGVTTSRSAVQHQQMNKARDRLAREGSLEAGAAVIKQLMQGR